MICRKVHTVDKSQQLLLGEAKAAATSSYSPYSRFRVGAAVSADGKVFRGANIENATSNLGICAERVALAMALMNGATKIDGIAIYCMDAKIDDAGNRVESQALPCGACRQWLAELAPQAWIVTNASDTAYLLRDLLPKAFSLEPLRLSRCHCDKTIRPSCPRVR
jgi:cytidine deaminase